MVQLSFPGDSLAIIRVWVVLYIDQVGHEDQPTHFHSVTLLRSSSPLTDLTVPLIWKLAECRSRWPTSSCAAFPSVQGDDSRIGARQG